MQNLHSEQVDNHSNCLICDSQNLVDLQGYESAHLSKCNNCGFVFCKRIPTIQELEEHYKGYGRNDYLSPITIKRYNELLDEFEKYRSTNRILDVGCGIGYFLDEAKKRGWEVYGTEYTDEAVEICTEKGHSIQKGKLDPNNYEEGYFDVITSFEVLEHINNPQEEIQNFHSILRQGGLVYLTTPNFNSMLRYRLKSEYNVICYPEHLSYYTPKTIHRLFKNSGFKKKKIQTTGYSRTRLKTSQNKSDQAFISEKSDDEQIRNKIEKSSVLQLAKNTVNFGLTVLGTGDSLKIRYEKK
ncbi:class I SAM-dependent methyltransferase [Crocinitomicaceae bacterium]|nr:class I SAM-dependent methyltransferase [Crocinitomicaceae bacterium]MDC0257822.1 class I SAM-dependent methyltransferase [Crocinitomicaceae bacterium]